MFIHEAVKKAMEKKCFISRKTIDNEYSFRLTRIKPTNSYANCIVYTFEKDGKEISHCKNWNPSAEDLIANDWVLID